MSLLSQRQYPDRPEASAFHGVVGEIIRTLEPHTESDPAALLLQLLTALGNAIGRGPYFKIEADLHFPNLFLVIVGKTSKARKGTSWGHIHAIIRQVADQDWVADAVRTGLSSGEGLIYEVRDEVRNDEGKVVDSGIPDKRRLIVQTEFASVLSVMKRDANILSAVMREAWDKGNLATLTKHSPLRATQAHISIIGHITEADLRRHLTGTDEANGFANRFLWACARRSKLLPDGGNLDAAELAPLVTRLREAVEWARNLGGRRLHWNPPARQRWHQVYEELSHEHQGLVGAITSRGEAQILRLALLFAVLDRCEEICLQHLEAALAVWNYCESSAAFIFGGSLGDPVADDLLVRLREAGEKGLTRTEIRDAFARHAKPAEIASALGALQVFGLARCAEEKTGGRPVQRWWAIEPATEATKATKAGEAA